MSRKICVYANWKMNKTLAEVTPFLNELTPVLDKVDSSKVSVAVATPSAFFETFSKSSPCQQQKILLLSQNIYHESTGAFTGEESFSILEGLHISGSLIGHSERRAIFKENDELIAKKVQSTVEQNKQAVLCVGETLEEREQDKGEQVVQKQLDAALKNQKTLENIVIAYEPVWAIGTGKTATPELAEKMHAFIRGWLAERFSTNCANSCSVLYGGSVKPENFAELLNCENIDGSLIGGASLKADSFSKLIEAALDIH